MTERESHIAKMIGDRIRTKDPKADVILLGSHARGQANEESDWETRHIFSPLYKNIKKEGLKIA